MHVAVKGRRLLWLGAGVVSGAVLAGGVAYASIPDANDVIHGCYAKRGGSLRVIDTGAGGACSASKEFALDWNRTGLPGADGSPGAPGPGATTFQSTLTYPGDWTTLATAADSGVVVQGACGVQGPGLRIMTDPAGASDRLEAYGAQSRSGFGVVPVTEWGANNNVTLTTVTAVPMTFNVIARNSTPTPKPPFAGIDVGGGFDNAAGNCRFSGMITPSD